VADSSQDGMKPGAPGAGAPKAKVQKAGAPVAPGKQFNTLASTGIAGRIDAEFERFDVTTLEMRRKVRVVRPGAILLPNLDIDEKTDSARKRFTAKQVDSADEIINDSDDSDEPTKFSVVEPSPVPGNAVRVILRVHKDDAARVRIFRTPTDSSAPKPVIGPKQGNTHVVEDSTKSPPAAGWIDGFSIEALTLAGAPDHPSPNELAPPSPGKLAEPKPETSGGSEKTPSMNVGDTSKSIYPDDKQNEEEDSRKKARAPGDVWVELVHETPGGPSDDLRDVGLFTIAPWLLTPNTLPCKRVYVVCFQPKPGTDRAKLAMTFLEVMTRENHGSVWDIKSGCASAGLGEHPDPDTTQPIPITDTKTVRTLDDAPFHTIGSENADADPWIQDEVEIGYCYAPHAWMHVAVHVRRTGAKGDHNLGKFVVNHMAHAGLGLFNGAAGTSMPDGMGGFYDDDSINFGGNLEVSPPVLKTTAKISDDRGGPAIPEHPIAPFGKLILGDGSRYPVHPQFRQFLLAQKVQPILPIDTAWLTVRHVDEILSFICSDDERKFKMLFASPIVMQRLLSRVLDEAPLVTMHVGKYVADMKLNAGGGSVTDLSKLLTTKWNYGEVRVDDFVDKHWSHNLNLVVFKLDPIKKRLVDGLALKDDPKWGADVLPIPMFFKKNNRSANAVWTASSIGMVNMLVANGHLMVPRPFGPRLLPEQARRVLEKVFKDVFPDDPPLVRLTLPEHHFVWARPGEPLRVIAMYFADPDISDPAKKAAARLALIKRIDELFQVDFKDPEKLKLDDLDPEVKKAVDKLTKDIIMDPINFAGGGILPQAGGLDSMLDKDQRFREWMRVHIPGKTIDVVEAYMESILRPTGNIVHFVDDFEFYHENFGEVHCGTNAVRNPSEVSGRSLRRWWDPGVYEPSRDVSYFPIGADSGAPSDIIDPFPNEP